MIKRKIKKFPSIFQALWKIMKLKCIYSCFFGDRKKLTNKINLNFFKTLQMSKRFFFKKNFKSFELKRLSSVT